MKLFSRTSLVALGTAAAISASALSAPAFAQETSAPETTVVAPTDTEVPGDVIEAVLELGSVAQVNAKLKSAITPIEVSVTEGQAASFAATGLPAGLKINAVNGEIYGTPTAKGTFNVTVTATSAVDAELTAQTTFNIVVGDASTTPTTEPESGSSDTDNINDWIKIITAVIGALTTILTFSTKLDGFMK